MRPTLIVLDAAIQRQDAADLCQTLRTDPHTIGIPVLVLVLDPPADAREAAAVAASWLQRGVDDVLVGPVPPEVLASRAHLLMELRRLRQDAALALRTAPSETMATRRVFDSALRQESHRLRRSDGHLAVLLIEIDGVATCRAEGGDMVAENLINRVAATVVGRLRRPPDVAARFGPDQIACLLPETDLRGARVVAESVRGAVANMGLTVPGAVTERPVTVSVGLASHRCSGPEVEHWLLAEARDRLTQSRRAGGNRLTAQETRRPVLNEPPSSPASGGVDFSLDAESRRAGW